MELNAKDKIHSETSESLMATREDLKLNFDEHEENEFKIEKMQEQIENFSRSQIAYENLIQNLYSKLNLALQENKSNLELIQKLELKNEQLTQQLFKFQSFSSSPTITSEKKISKSKSKESIHKEVKSLSSQTISTISSKLHLEFHLLSQSLKQKYKSKLKQKKKSWVAKYQSLDNFYQESLQSLQLLHLHRLTESNQQSDRLIHSFLHPSMKY